MMDTNKTNHIVDQYGRKVGYTTPAAFDNMMVWLKDDATGEYQFRKETHNFKFFCTEFALDYKLVPCGSEEEAAISNDETWISLSSAILEICKNLDTGISNHSVSSESQAMNIARQALARFSIEDYYSVLMLNFGVMGNLPYTAGCALDFAMVLSYDGDVLDGETITNIMMYSNVSTITQDHTNQTLLIEWQSIV